MAGTKVKRARQAAELREKGSIVVKTRAGTKEIVASPPAPPPVGKSGNYAISRYAGKSLDEIGVDGLVDCLIEGDSIRDIARVVGCSPSSVLRWIDADAERVEQYLRAKEEQADTYASELRRISEEPVPTNVFGNMDSAAVQDKRLRIDTLKWVASKLKPKVYGEKVDLTSGGDPIKSMSESQIDARLAMLMKQLMSRKEEEE